VGEGVIGHCVSPQPWREIDAHGCKVIRTILRHAVSLERRNFARSSMEWDVLNSVVFTTIVPSINRIFVREFCNDVKKTLLSRPRSKPRPLYQDQVQDQDSGSQDQYQEQDLHNFQDQDQGKTFISRPRPRPRRFSYFCIKISDHSFSVNINNNTKIIKEYIHCVSLH